MNRAGRSCRHFAGASTLLCTLAATWCRGLPPGQYSLVVNAKGLNAQGASGSSESTFAVGQ